MNLFPYDSKYDFMRVRWIALAISAAMLVAAIVALGGRGLNFALDFTGGNLIEVRFEKPADLAAMRAELEAAGFENATVQSFGSQYDVVIRLRPVQAAAGEDAAKISQETGAAVLAALAKGDNPAELKRSDFVGPQVGRELAENGMLAIVFVAIGFLIYISARFEWKFAIAAILTTLHDVVVVTGYFALTQRDFDLNVLAGILSIMGYSINDTIVVFDRVRENFKGLRGVAPPDVLNRSVNQTLSRTIITSFVAFLTVLALYLYGGSALEGMALALMLGIVIGTLSSIFFACPLLLWFGVTKQDLMPKARDLTELERRP
jgi:preprotein translocase subunit SecF